MGNSAGFIRGLGIFVEFSLTEAAAWRRRRRRGARRWRWCAAVAQRRSSARWQRRHDDSGAVMAVAHRAAAGRVGATAAAGGGDAAGATAAGASSGDGQRGGASTAASRRSTEEFELALAAEIKTWKESDVRECRRGSRRGRPPSSRAPASGTAVLSIFPGVKGSNRLLVSQRVKHTPPERHGFRSRPCLF